MNKKAVSQLLAYSIMIIIAVALSGLVYTFLYQNIPKDEVDKCPQNINLAIEKINCLIGVAGDADVETIISNRGLFSVKGFSVAVRSENSTADNKIEESSANRQFEGEERLTPGEATLQEFNSIIFPKEKDNLVFELKPIVLNEEGLPVLCDEQIITKTFSCELEEGIAGVCYTTSAECHTSPHVADRCEALCLESTNPNCRRDCRYTLCDPILNEGLLIC